MVRMNINKIIIHFCLIFKIPFPKKIQISILRTARLCMHRSIGMCGAIKESIRLLYGVEYEKVFHELRCFIPVFTHDNFISVTGIEKYSAYWTTEKDKYNRMKFLKWCEMNVQSK